MIARRPFLLSFLAAALAAPRLALAQAADPAAPIAALNNALIGVMKAGKSTPFPQRAAMLRPAVQAAFDLPAILQASVGVRWAGFPEQTRADLLAAFIDFTVDTWVSNFDSFGGEKFVMLPDRRAVGSDQVVATQIVPTSGDPTRLDYVMRQGSGGWKAVDVLFEGTISRVAVQRSDFRSLLAGGKPDPLLAMLRRKATELSGK